MDPDTAARIMKTAARGERKANPVDRIRRIHGTTITATITQLSKGSNQLVKPRDEESVYIKGEVNCVMNKTIKSVLMGDFVRVPDPRRAIPYHNCERLRYIWTETIDSPRITFIL
jgi:hypothetical protein